MGPGNVFIEMFLAFPLFNEMKYPGSVNISNKFIPDASALLANGRDDLLNFTDKIAVPCRHDGTTGVDKYHTYSAVWYIQIIVRVSGPVPFSYERWVIMGFPGIIICLVSNRIGDQVTGIKPGVSGNPRREYR
jgi:hypothetical protein